MDKKEETPAAVKEEIKKSNPSKGGVPQDKVKGKKEGAGEVDKNFMHLVRVSGTVLDGNKDIARAITDIKGVGPHISRSLIRILKFDKRRKLGTLNESEIETIEKTISDLNKNLPRWALNRTNDYSTGKDNHLIGPDLDLAKRGDINLQSRIRSYRGVRHMSGQPVRGQRTRTSFRKGATIGVVRRKQQPAEKPASKDGGKSKK